MLFRLNQNIDEVDGGWLHRLRGKELKKILVPDIVAEFLFKFDPRQPRDAHGRWSKSGGGAIYRDRKRTAQLNGARKDVDRFAPNSKAKDAYTLLSHMRKEAQKSVYSGVGESTYNKRAAKKENQIDDSMRFPMAWSGANNGAMYKLLGKEFGRGNYDHLHAATQKVLKASGVSHLTVYRGVSQTQSRRLAQGMRGKKVTVPVNTLSAWSLSHDEAKKFATQWGGGAVVSMKVPRRHVLVSSVHAKRGWHSSLLREKEVVLAIPDKRIILRPKDVEFHGKYRG